MWLLLWIITFFTGLIWSLVHPHDYFTWLLEIFPALVGAIILASTYRLFIFSKFTYSVILIHCLILMIGGHYTYEKVPLFDWLSIAFDWHRNNYDKLGHFFQGFAPAMVARELLICKKVINSKKWISFITINFCLALSALYEILEWWVAILTGDSATAFLGTQGYIWDTQSDMLFALIGAVFAIIFFSKVQDLSIQAHGSNIII